MSDTGLKIGVEIPKNCFSNFRAVKALLLRIQEI